MAKISIRRKRRKSEIGELEERRKEDILNTIWISKDSSKNKHEIEERIEVE